ncbi:MAG: glutathione S-transferase family protein [Devosia sp.]
MLRILGRVTSINVRKVLWAADEMGLAYEREDWGLPTRDPKVPEYLKLNPNGQVPTIVEPDGFVLWESNAIVRYLADRERSGLWPVEPRERALVDQWLTWQATELNPSWVYAVNALMRKNPAFGNAGDLERSKSNWTKAMRVLEGQLQAGGGFVANGRLSLADLVLALSTHRWLSTPFDRPALPAVEAHFAQMQKRPAAAAYLGAATP